MGSRIISYLKKPKTVLYGMLIAALALTVCIYLNSPPKTFPEVFFGRPAVSMEYSQLDIKVEQVVACDGYLYTQLGNSSGVVQVYDLSGNYQHTLFFFTHMKGFFSLAAEEKNVYVQDMQGNVYVLCEGEFDRLLLKFEAQDRLGDLDFASCASSEDYEIRENAIWRVTESGEQCIVEAPETSTLSSGRLLAAGGCILSAMGLLYLRKRKRSPGT